MRTGKLFKQCIVGLIGFITLPVFAQNPQQQVTVEIKVAELGIIDLGKKTEPVFKFFLGNGIEGKNLDKHGRCFHFESKTGNEKYYLPNILYPGQDPLLVPFSLPLSEPLKFDLALECFEDDKGDVCMFDSKDEFHSVTTRTFDLNEFTPGDFSSPIEIKDEQQHFYVLVQIRYTLLPPEKIICNPVLAEVNNAATSIELSTQYPLAAKHQLKFNWEYSLNEGKDWFTAFEAKPENLSYSLIPSQDIFHDTLMNTVKVLFRNRVNSRDTVSFSSTYEANFTPAPPLFTPADLSIIPTCKGMAVGSIQLKNLQSVTGNASYVLRRVVKNELPCMLTNPSSTSCAGFVTSGNAKNDMIEINRLPADSFELLLFNSNLLVGKVATKIPLRINEYPGFTVMDITQKNPTCFDYKAGEIVANLTGGSSEDSWQVELRPLAGTMERKPGVITFRNLEEADYFLQVSDGCGSVINKNVYLKKPEALQIQSIRKEGSTGRVYYLNIKNGSGRFDITISNKDQLQKKFDSSNQIITFPLPGVWKIHIIDKDNPDCLWVDTTINVATLHLKHLKYEISDFRTSGQRSENENQLSCSKFVGIFDCRRVKFATNAAKNWNSLS